MSDEDPMLEVCVYSPAEFYVLTRLQEDKDVAGIFVGTRELYPMRIFLFYGGLQCSLDQ